MKTTNNFKRQVYNEVKRRGLISEQELEMGTGGFKEIISVLFHSRNQVHIYHLQTESYAEHKALQDYYDGVLDLIDGLVESYQGKYGILTNYTTLKVDDYVSNDEVQSYLNKVNSVIEKNRTSVKEPYIQNQIDSVQELIFSTLYKLKFLK